MLVSVEQLRKQEESDVRGRQRQEKNYPEELFRLNPEKAV